jgi:thioredoxin-dependent peroxiredoxin
MKRHALFCFLGFTLVMFSLAVADSLNVGASAPQITAMDDSGNSVDFGQLYSKGMVLVYFYPKADTSGCTAQGCSLRDSWEELQKQGVQVIGVSADPADAQKSFREKYKFPFPLIADVDRKVIDAFGVPTAEGKSRPARQSFLIKDGKIVWKAAPASTKTHAADVLKAVAELSKSSSGPKELN